jgi:hypothetical protein
LDCLYLHTTDGFIQKTGKIMKNRLLGYLSLITFILTILWLILLAISISSSGPMDSYEQVVSQLAKPDILFYLIYINAALTVFSVVFLYSGLFVYLNPYSPMLAEIGRGFIPVYAVMNLFVYLSQITIVPGLIALREQPAMQAPIDILLRQMIQQWSGSGAAFFNNLAYAILAIPSILFGLLLLGRNRNLQVSGILMALNGVACLAGIVGILMGNTLLGSGSLVGGVLFLLSLIPMSLHFLKQT